MRGECRSTQKPHNKEKKIKLWSLHRLPSNPNIRKEWMNFIFNEVPDHVSKNFFVHFILPQNHLLTKHNLTQDFSKRLNLKDTEVPTILDIKIMLHFTGVSNYLYYVVTIALSVITVCLICTEYVWVFNLYCSSVHL